MKFYKIILPLLALCLSACVSAPEPVPEEETAPAIAPEPEPAKAPEETPEPEGTEELFGSLNGTGYENPWFGFGADLEAAGNIETAEAGAADPAQGETVRALTAAPESGEWELSLDVSGAGANAEEAQYAAAMKTLAPEAYAEAGLELLESGTETLSFAGGEHAALRCRSAKETENGETVTVYQLTVFLRSGRYIAAVTATTYLEDYTDSLLGGFYALA